MHGLNIAVFACVALSTTCLCVRVSFVSTDYIYLQCHTCTCIKHLDHEIISCNNYT